MSKLIVRLEHDPDLENPANWDDQWKPYSFSRKHVNFKHPDDLDLNSIGMRRKLEVGTAFLLSYYEHGECSWFLADGPITPGVEFQWDGVRFAGVLLWEHPVSHMGAKTREDRAKDAARFLETYTAWCNGHGYYFCIEDEDGEHVDSCGGFYGGDEEHMFDMIRPHLVGHEYEVEVDCAWLAKYHDLDKAVASV